MRGESGAGQSGTEAPDGECERTQDQHFTTLPKMTRMRQASGGLNHLVTRAGGAQWTWRKATVVVDSGAAENVMPRSVFSEISTEESEKSKNGKGFEGPGGEHIRSYWPQVMSVRTR